MDVDVVLVVELLVEGQDVEGLIELVDGGPVEVEDVAVELVLMLGVEVKVDVLGVVDVAVELPVALLWLCDVC